MNRRDFLRATALALVAGVAAALPLKFDHVKTNWWHLGVGDKVGIWAGDECHECEVYEVVFDGHGRLKAKMRAPSGYAHTITFA